MTSNASPWVVGSFLLCYLLATAGPVFVDPHDQFDHQFVQPVVLRTLDQKLQLVDLSSNGPVLLGSSTAFEIHMGSRNGTNLALNGASFVEERHLLDIIDNERELILGVDTHQLRYGSQVNRVDLPSFSLTDIPEALVGPLDRTLVRDTWVALWKEDVPHSFDENGDLIRTPEYAKSEQNFERHPLLFSNMEFHAIPHLKDLLKLAQKHPNVTIYLPPVHPEFFNRTHDNSYLEGQNLLRRILVQQCSWAHVFDMTSLEFSWNLFHDSIHFPRDVGEEIMGYIEAGEGNLCN